jgi:hypothetical protein
LTFQRKDRAQVKNITTIWLPKPETKDFAAANDYLSLLFLEKDVAKLVKRLHVARPIGRAAKDILRASQLTILGPSNSHVISDLKKIRKSKLLSPILLIRGDAHNAAPLVIADGFHRVCASWYWSEDAPFPAA